MSLWASDRCDVNNYTGITNIRNECSLICGQDSSGSKTAKAKKCCKMKYMFLNHSIIVAGIINKTAMASFYGAFGDPQTVENIVECEAIGENHFYSSDSNYLII